MEKFVAEKIGIISAIDLIEQHALGRAIIAGLMMLEAVGIHVIGEAEQKIVMIVVMRLEEGLGFADEMVVAFEFVLRNLNGIARVAGEIKTMRRLHFGGQRNRTEIFTHQHGRIDEGGQRDGLELGGAIVGFLLELERGAIFPAVGHAQNWLVS